MIYFDNAASSLPKAPGVAEALTEALTTFGGPGRGTHPATLLASRCVFKARKLLAEMFGVSPERMVFTCNATESLNTAILGLLSPSDHAITTVMEHNSVLRPLYALQDRGMGLSIVDADPAGNIDARSFQSFLQPNTKAVVCTHASNLTGNLTDLHGIIAFCKQNNLYCIVDAAQTAGMFPIDVDKMGIDVLCFTGHKSLLGPQGTGGLCLGKGVKLRPLKEGGSGIQSYAERHPAELPEALEAGTLNAHGIAGLLASATYIRKTGMEVIRTRELLLSKQFYEGVSGLPGVRCYGNFTHPRGPIVTLNIGSLDSSKIADRLAYEYGICVRGGAHCAPLAHIALGTREQGAVRFSFSSFNTEAEIDKGLSAVRKIAEG